MSFQELSVVVGESSTFVLSTTAQNNQFGQRLALSDLACLQVVATGTGRERLNSAVQELRQGRRPCCKDVVCHADFGARVVQQNHAPDRRPGLSTEHVVRETRRERREVVCARPHEDTLDDVDVLENPNVEERGAVGMDT